MIGLALGSGAARGWPHIGVIEALAEMGVVPDIICGTSVGALVGAAHVTGQLGRLHDRLETFKRQDVVSLHDLNFAAGGLIEGTKIEAFLTGLGISGNIEDSSKSFAAVATDLSSGREIWIRTGPIDKAVRASISIPGVFSPVRLGNEWLLDGGLVNPVPVSLCRALGADFIIAVDLNSDALARRFTGGTAAATPAPNEWLSTALKQLPPAIGAPLAPFVEKLLNPAPAVPAYFDVLNNALNIMQDHITRTRLAGEPPHVLLRPELADINWLDFHRAAECVAEGRDCVQRAAGSLGRYLELKASSPVPPSPPRP
jgi:NTE family protein